MICVRDERGYKSGSGLSKGRRRRRPCHVYVAKESRKREREKERAKNGERNSERGRPKGRGHFS